MVSCTKDDGIYVTSSGMQKSALMGEWRMIEETEYSKEGHILAQNFVSDEICPPEIVEFLDYNLATQVSYSKEYKDGNCELDKIYKEYHVANDKLFVGYGKDLENNAEYEITITKIDGDYLELEHMAHARVKRGYGHKTVKVKTHYYRVK
jgi:hypothetical protein